MDIDLLTRGAGFGYLGSTFTSLIYASFTFIFFALEAAILSPLASPRHRPEVFLGEHLEVGAPVKLMIRGYAFDPNYQDHFRSDVIERVTKMFAATK